PPTAATRRRRGPAPWRGRTGPRSSPPPPVQTPPPCRAGCTAARRRVGVAPYETTTRTTLRRSARTAARRPASPPGRLVCTDRDAPRETRHLTCHPSSPPAGAQSMAAGLQRIERPPAAGPD